jgi:hypothetical protein
MNNISFFKALLMKELDQNKSSSEFEIPVDVKIAYKLWKDPNFPPGKLYGFSSGMKNPKDILNRFASELQNAGLIKVSAPGHLYVDALKWLDDNNEKLDEKDGAEFTKKYNDDPKLKGGQKNLPDQLQAQIVKKEGEDHEVSMAQNSLKSIISSASQLMNLLGQDEKDVPAWIQDHITNAENFINQASKNYHEYNEGNTGEYDMDELPDGTIEKPAGDAEDLDMTLQSMMESVVKRKKAK